MISPNKKWKIYNRDGGRCFYCKEYLLINEMTVDHKKPKSMGGVGEMSNLILSCEKCNQDKGSMTFLEYCVFKRIRVHGMRLSTMKKKLAKEVSTPQ